MSSCDGYPWTWKIWAYVVKEEAGWKCEECGVRHNPEKGYCLTVHHKNGIKSDLKRKNLIALCQRCHLRAQGKLLRQQAREACEEAGQLSFKFGSNL